MERIFLRLKMERVRQRQYANQDEARRDINQYIVGFYYAVRLKAFSFPFCRCMIVCRLVEDSLP